MIIVTSDDIEKGFGKVASLEEDKANDYMEEFASKQPYILAYALSASEQMEKQDLVENIIWFTCGIWESFLLKTSEIPIVEEDAITQSEEKFLKKIQKLEANLDPSKVESVFDAFPKGNQNEIFEMLADETVQLMEDHSNQNEVILFYNILFIITSAFDRVLNYQV